jgi:hypothetical protein
VELFHKLHREQVDLAVMLNTSIRERIGSYLDQDTGYTQKQKKNSGALVLQQTIPSERPPLVGEVSANFSGQRVSRGQRNESPRPLISVF